MNLKFKTRIAFLNTLALASVNAALYLIIYFIVYDTAYSHLDEHIASEKDKVINNLNLRDNSIITNRLVVWDKIIHEHIEVNPIFLEIKNEEGAIIFSSSSLLAEQKLVEPTNSETIFYNGILNKQRIRLGRFPIENEEGKRLGEVIIAVSGEGTYNVLHKLIWVLIISFPVVLLILFLASSLATSRSIRPVNRLIQTASQISGTNISTRLKLPPHKDELFDLTTTLNELLERIENSIIQQKQFTSDASHEIRTPIAAIRGTLEVLLRKERNPEVYVEKISGIIKEFDRLDAMLDQLLQLARVGSEKVLEKDENIILTDAINVSVRKWEPVASERDISIVSNIPKNAQIHANEVYFELILDNLLGNAIKYGKEHGNVTFRWNRKINTLAIQDDGIGISQEHLPNIFNRFYRADESRSSMNKGNGLGLSIVKKLASLQNIEINAESIPDKGSTFYLRFPD